MKTAGAAAASSSTNLSLAQQQSSLAAPAAAIQDGQDRPSYPTFAVLDFAKDFTRMAGVISASKLTNNNTDVIAIEEVNLTQAELKLAGDALGGKPSRRSRSKKHGFDRKKYTKREARRLQRSIEMIACLSEMEEDSEENVFSLDELGEKSEEYCDTFQISVDLKRKAYRRCKHKSLNESFEAQKNEPLIFSQLVQPNPTTDVARGKETSRQIFKSSFKRLQAKDAAMWKSRPLALPAPPQPREVKQVVVVRRQPESCALLAIPWTTPSLSPIRSGWIEQSMLHQKSGPKAKNMSSFRSLAQRLFG